MKNTFHFKLKQSLLIISLFFISNCISQICPGFSVVNNTTNGCSVTIAYKVFDVNTCTLVCTGNATLIPGANITIASACINGFEDIEILVTSITGASTVNFGSGASGGGAWACYYSGNPANMSDSATDPCFGTYNILVTCSVATIW